MYVTRWIGLICLVVVASVQANGDGKVYKHVDKSGKVTYSQTPPADGKPAEKMDVKPAARGHAGSYDAQHQFYERGNYGYQEPYRPPVISTQRPLTVQEQRQAALQAECERNRGTDCSNPATLQYLDSTSIPRRGRY